MEQSLYMPGYNAGPPQYRWQDCPMYNNINATVDNLLKEFLAALAVKYIWSEWCDDKKTKRLKN